jgi:hypothetical protein
LTETPRAIWDVGTPTGNELLIEVVGAMAYATTLANAG